MAQCLIHRTGSMFRAYISVTGSPNSTVTATLGSKVFTGTTNAQGIVTILVKKKGTYTVTSTASGAQTKTVDVLEMKQTYSVNISGKFSIKISHTNSSVSVTRNTSPYGKASTGALSDGAIIYYGDTFTVTGTANDGFDSWTKTVTGATLSGTTYTATGDVTVSTGATPIKYKVSITENTGTKVTVKRTTVGTPGKVAGATIETLSDGGLIYKGDVLTISTEASKTAYKDPTLEVNNSTFTSGNTYTVTGNVTVTASTTVKSYTLTITSASKNTLTVSRTESAYGGAATGSLSTLATIYHGDKLKISQSPATNYSGTYTVVNNGSTVVDKATADNTITVAGAVTATSTATAQTITITIKSRDSRETILFAFTLTPGNPTWASMIGTGQWRPNSANVTTRYLPTWASNGRYCSDFYFHISGDNVKMVWSSYHMSDSDSAGSDKDYDAKIYKTNATTSPLLKTATVTGGTYYAPFTEV